MFRCCKWDIQSDSHCVLADFPLILPETEWRVLCDYAEGLAAETVKAELELIDRHELHEMLAIPKAIRRELKNREFLSNNAVRVMRFDFHFTENGWKITEVNADVPGGYIEASGITSLLGKCYSDCIVPPCPVESYAEALLGATGSDALVAMVHATGYSDDRQVIQFLGRKLAECGLRVWTVSPTHLRWDKGKASLCPAFGSQKVDAIFRFYPAEWLPTLSNSALWAPYFRGSCTPITNPGSAILVQSKRFPFVWDMLHTEMKLWRRLLPETRSVQKLEFAQDWVVKPIFGRVGEDIAIPSVTSPDSYKQILKNARRHPSQWIAQKRFEAMPIYMENEMLFPAIGVFTLNGRAIGIYGRIAKKPLIDNDAQDVVVLISAGGQA